MILYEKTVRDLKKQVSEEEAKRILTRMMKTTMGSGREISCALNGIVKGGDCFGKSNA